MSVSISFEFGNLKELQAFLAKQSGDAAPAKALTEAPAEETPTEDTGLDANGDEWDAEIHDSKRAKTAAGVWRKRRGRRAASETTEEAPAPKKAKGPTLDDVRDALKNVAEAFDVERCKEILKQFHVKQIRGLDEDKYAKFIAACEEAVSGEEEEEGLFD